MSSPTDARRYAVFSPGFSGSKWLATVLTRPDQGLVAFHEPVKHLVTPSLHGRPTFSDAAAPLRREALLEALAPYFAWIDRRSREVPVLGEIHTHPLFYWPMILDRVPESRLFLVRHGVQTVHGMAVDVAFRDGPVERAWALRGLSSDRRAGPVLERTFAGVCEAWAALPSLAAKITPGRVFRLEDLTANASALQDVHEHLTGRAIDPAWSTELRGRVVHKKTRGDNSPANLFWNVWTDSLRDIFVATCGEAMRELGYELPSRSDAPPPDLRPREPHYQGPLPLGPLTNVWGFTEVQPPRDVLVLGQPRYVRAAALLLGSDRAVLLDQGGLDTGDLAAPFRRCSVESIEARQYAGVYVADPSPDPSAVDRLRALQPDAEIVAMQPGSLDDDDLATLSAAGPLGARRSVTGPAAAPEQRRPPDVTVTAFGPFRTGDAISGWVIDSLLAAPDKLTLTLSRDTNLQLTFDLCVKRGSHHTPFPVGDGAVYYRETPIGFQQVSAPARAIAKTVLQAIGDRSLADCFAGWLV